MVLLKGFLVNLFNHVPFQAVFSKLPRYSFIVSKSLKWITAVTLIGDSSTDFRGTLNKRACYHRHILRPFFFVKKAYKQMKTFFFSKKHFILFSNFSNFQNFPIFCQKNLIIRAERHFKEIIPFDTHSTANLPPLSILKKFKFFSKNPSIFSKKPKFRTF